MQLPPPREAAPLLPVDPLDTVGGAGTAVPDLPFAPIALPTIVAPLGAGAGPGAGPAMPAAPRSSGSPGSKGQSPQRGGHQTPPAYGASNGTMPSSFRAGYGEYLRTARVGQIVAVAVPGVAGILLLTGTGGVLGYRQARAGHAVRANGTARFVG